MSSEKEHDAFRTPRPFIEQRIGGKITHGLPYTINRTGDYGWVNPDEGFTSTAAWYVLAKHRFNPLRLKSNPPVEE